MHRTPGQLVWIMILIVSACAGPKYGQWGNEDGNDFRPWGVDPARRGWVEESLSFPLRMAWQKKIQGVPAGTFFGAGDGVFFGTRNGMIYGLDVADGRILWSRKSREKTENTCVVTGSRVIAVKRSDRPSLAADDIASGETAWKRDAGAIVGEPLLAGDTLIAANEEGRLVWVETGTGEIIRQAAVGDPMISGVSSCGDTLFLCTEKGSFEARSARDGALIWRRKTGDAFMVSPVCCGKRIFAGSLSGRLYCLESSTGSILWERRSSGGIFFKVSADDRHLFWGDSRGSLFCSDQVSGSEVWRFDSGSPVGADPAVIGGCVLFCTMAEEMHALDRMTGREIWRFKTRGRVRTVPHYWKKHVLIGSEEQIVYAFASDGDESH